MKRLPTVPVRRAPRLAAGALILSLVATITACAGDAPPPAIASPYGSFMAGLYAAQTGDHGAAADYFGAALAHDPDNSLLRGQGFISALLANRADAARLAASLPADPLARMVRGNQDALAGKWQAAAKQFSALPSDGVTGLVRPLLLAWCEAGDTSYGSAIRRLEQATSRGAYAPVYLLNAAIIADIAGREAQAAHLYAASAQGVGTPNLRLALIFASFAARAGHSDRARAILERMVAAHPDLRLALPALEKQVTQPVISTASQGLAEAYLTLSGSIGDDHNRLLRRVLLRFALELRPDLSAARLLQANFDMAAKKPDEAVATLARIGRQDALYAPALMQRAQILSGQGKGKPVLPALEALAKAHPQAVAPVALAADIERDAGDYDAAIRLYTEALRLVGVKLPASAWSLYYGRAIAEDKAKDWPRAEADLQRALQLDPGQPFVLNYLGYSYALRGEHLDAAERMIRSALAVAPNEGAIVDSLGYVLLREGKIAEAMKTQIRAVHLMPDDPEVNAHLADIFEAAGNHLAAEHQWARALGLDPSPAARARIEAKLKQAQAANGS